MSSSSSEEAARATGTTRIDLEFEELMIGIVKNLSFEGIKLEIVIRDCRCLSC